MTGFWFFLAVANLVCGNWIFAGACTVAATFANLAANEDGDEK